MRKHAKNVKNALELFFLFPSNPKNLTDGAELEFCEVKSMISTGSSRPHTSLVTQPLQTSFQAINLKCEEL